MAEKSLDPFLDPLRTYKIERNAEYARVHRGRIIDNATIEKNMEDKRVTSSFWVKLQGTFFMFAGYLGNPDNKLTVNESIYEMRGTNHAGIFDYLTFGIPYAIEAFFRGNIFESKRAQDICQAIFTIIPIVPVLATIRNSIAVIATIVSFFPVGIIHICDVLYNSCKTYRPEIQIAAHQHEKDNGDLNLKEFMDSYKSLTNLFKAYQTAEQMETIGDKWAISQRTIQFHRETVHYAKMIRESYSNNPENLPAFFNKKKDKIEEGGKYSYDAIQKKFG